MTAALTANEFDAMERTLIGLALIFAVLIVAGVLVWPLGRRRPDDQTQSVIRRQGIISAADLDTIGIGETMEIAVGNYHEQACNLRLIEQYISRTGRDLVYTPPRPCMFEGSYMIRVTRIGCGERQCR